MKLTRDDLIEDWFSAPKDFLDSSGPEHISPTFYQSIKDGRSLQNIQIVFRPDKRCFWAVFANPAWFWLAVMRKKQQRITVRFYVGEDYYDWPITEGYSVLGRYIGIALGSLPDNEAGSKFIDYFAMSKSVDILSGHKVIFSSKTAPPELDFGLWLQRMVAIGH